MITNSQMNKEEIMSLLKSDIINDVEKGIEAFSLYINSNSTDELNATYEFFGLDKDDFDETKIVEIDILKEILVKFKDLLPSKSICKIVDATLGKNIYDNFQVTIDSIIILIERKDVEAQNSVVEAFKSACEYYDAGHRYWEETVQDQLLDNLFPKFEGEPLVNLLTWCSSDFLMNDMGLDGMDSLFQPAFSKIKDPVLEKKLLDRFTKYIVKRDKNYIKSSGLLDGYEDASKNISETITSFKESLK